MAQQTEIRTVINGKHYVGFEASGQFITIYLADKQFRPVTAEIEGVWTIRSETIRWGAKHTLNEVEIRQHFVKRDGADVVGQASPSLPSHRSPGVLKVLFRDFTIPPMSIASLVLAAFMLLAGMLILIDAPELGPLLGGLVFGSAILLLLFAMLGPFLW